MSREFKFDYLIEYMKKKKRKYLLQS